MTNRTAQRKGAPKGPKRRTSGRPSKAGLVGIGAVAVVVVALVVTSLLSGSPGPRPDLSEKDTKVVLQRITNVPSSAFEEAGAGTFAAVPIALPQQTADIVKDGKPEFVYLGAEYCPYCAAQRWPVVIALSRFGTWSNLTMSHSAADDAFPNTPTVSFSGAAFKSQYLAFTGIESQSNEPAAGGGYEKLDDVPDYVQALNDTYNKAPYGSGGIPFIMFANKYVLASTLFSPEMINRMDWLEISQSLSTPTSDPGKTILQSANLITAGVCKMTNDQPGEVCNSDVIVAAKAALGG